ncbi:MFS transporter [Streptomyces sp. NPDC013187]|uniref:MFS transporter n=1 Tax=Streptomyces sp. NPDC013187 TaxID=3364865 RepID=UPI00368F2BF1
MQAAVFRTRNSTPHGRGVPGENARPRYLLGPHPACSAPSRCSGDWAHFPPFPAPVATAFLGGLTTLPAFTVIRLALPDMVTEENRHTAYAVEAITTDVAYMAGPSFGTLLASLSGPSFGTLLASLASPTVAFLAMGTLLFAAGVAYLLLDPPLEAARPADGPKPRLRSRLTARMVCALSITAATSIAVIGFEIAALCTQQKSGQPQWSWLLLVAAGLASAPGGFRYGGMRRPPSVFAIGALLGVFCIPIGLATEWYWLCVLAAPANLLVAPALSASAGTVSRLAPDDSGEPGERDDPARDGGHRRHVARDPRRAAGRLTARSRTGVARACRGHRGSARRRGPRQRQRHVAELSRSAL